MSLVRRNNRWPSSSLLDDLLPRDFFNFSDMMRDGDSMPRVNIAESDDDFRVEMAAPGMKKEDFQISLDNDMLTISSETTRETGDRGENEKFSRKEFSYQSFRRSFYLPNTVETDKIEARYRDGILSLVIPKKEEVKKKPVKTITIS